MVKRIKSRSRIVKSKPTVRPAARPTKRSGVQPLDPPPAAYYEPVSEAEDFGPPSTPARRSATPREILAAELRQRREEVVRAMAAAQTEYAAANRAALDLQRLPASEIAMRGDSPWPVDPAIETAAEAATEAMHAANRAVEAAEKDLEKTADFLGAKVAAADQAMVDAMHAADRIIADSLHAAEEAVAHAVGGHGRPEGD